jgi:dihydroxy-acid dehydratase
MTALYLERFMNYGITAEELRSGRPIIGIAQSGSDISPCNRIHLELAKRVRDGIRDAGGIPMEFPLHPIFENCRRPTAAIDRNLAYLGLVEILHGYPIDAVVLTTGCDKTTPSQIMAAATVDIPAIVLSGGPMLDGWMDGELVGSGSAIWKGRKLPRQAASTTRNSWKSPPHRRLLRPLQHHGHGLHHERHGRGAGHVADRLLGHSRALSRTRPDGL